MLFVIPYCGLTSRVGFIFAQHSKGVMARELVGCRGGGEKCDVHEIEGRAALRDQLAATKPFWNEFQ